MLKVNVKEAGSMEKALKQLKKKVRKTRQNEEIKERKHFTKPSTKRKEVINKATYKNN